MNPLTLDCVQAYRAMAQRGVDKGWHERNGGNFTYRMNQTEIELIQDQLVCLDWYPLQVSLPDFAHKFFLVSGTGCYFLHMADDPLHTLGIIELNDTGDAYRIVWGLEGGKPTSELSTHLMNLSVDPTRRVIYHAHCPNVIAMTFVHPLDEPSFSQSLWSTMTECPIIFPEGVGVVEWMIPGGSEIAKVTAEKMKQVRIVLWAHHGLFCSGQDFDEAWGLMETVEKSAEIWLKIQSSGLPVLSSITPEKVKAVQKAFGIGLK